jgi:phosphate transport system substrate-binding protein
VLALPLALGLLAAACGDDAGGAGAGPTLNGSGSTFAGPFYDAVREQFAADHRDVTVNYGGGGSGKGREDLQNQIVDWAGTDSPVAAADLPDYKGGPILQFPTTVAPITVAYHLDGVDDLNLSPDTIAGIFQGEVTSWDAPEIAADNPGAHLPGTRITVAHRNDSSGTTDNFSRFLEAASGPQASGVWKLGSGSTIHWPASTQGGDGNPGVGQIVQSTNGAIGYVDLSDARAIGLDFAKVENKAGAFVAPTLEAATAAAEHTTVDPDLSFFAGWADGEDSYPITAQTWIVIYEDQPDAAKGAALKAFLQYLLTGGQELAEEIDYAALPDTMQQRALAQLDRIVVD